MGETVNKDMDSSVYLEEDAVKTAGASASNGAKHGDRAMQLVGEERVVLTEEDVSPRLPFSPHPPISPTHSLTH
ncbi:hypothetical protein O1611_g6893 [Lasiodiplodia mahajangana]|uniref:Uncharacterized protein n=1 Tax=Lasiodiplodia mahajangana TaxID=1108764 RepID=A0ACC2JHR8_9PEZI|nr:hypothetical protein O1611_g6893 [Lasiodiplodia mahajangana]